jgi:hypothetical protein
MLNKKIIAASIAAVFAQGALAAVNLDTQSGPVTYANDIVGFTLNGDGDLEVSNTGAGLLDVTSRLGFTIGAGTSKYILIQFDGASFDDTPALDVGGTAGSISQGGSIGSSTVLFEVAQPTGSGDLGQNEVVTLETSAYAIDPEVTSTVTYTLFETAQDAIDYILDPENNPGLFSAEGEFTNTGSGSSGLFANGFTNTATVQSDFTNFNGASLSATTAAIGEIDTDLVVSETTYNADGTETDATDFLADTQDVVFSGDMSFGTWTVQDTELCDGSGTSTGLTSTDENGGVWANVSDTTLDMNVWTLCVTVDGSEKIEKGDYFATLDEDEITNFSGRIVYDTTTIEVPYITTFYQQRLILVNTSNEDAAYSISFLTEPGTTATGLDPATGTIPADGMVVLATQGNDPFVSITGSRTRASATIEVESVDGNIQAATQTVSSDGTATDTVVLNANSVVSYSTLVNLFEDNQSN